MCVGCARRHQMPPYADEIDRGSSERGTRSEKGYRLKRKIQVA